MSKLYEKVTDRIINMLEEGQIPWKKNWKGNGGMPRNLVSGNKYSGINTFLLAGHGYDSPWFVTYKQAEKLGGNVKKGEKGHLVVFSTTGYFKKETETVDGEEKQVKKWVGYSRPIMKFYYIFNVKQCEDLDYPEAEERDNDPIESAQSIIDGYENGPEIEINKGDRAFYRPTEDKVVMPSRSLFNSSEDYYSVFFHELTHSTGAKSRLNRFEINEGLSMFGSESYSKEELVAELGSAFLCSEAGIKQDMTNSAAYIQGWLKALKDDKTLIVSASSKASKAAKHILGK